mmetsp:Transcript_39845/g.79870  ORF Transcript_39845/g.79870 Transcript_39845/m.79870 type:complete len:213 (-) Transcript_39845:116-754(-)
MLLKSIMIGEESFSDRRDQLSSPARHAQTYPQRPSHCSARLRCGGSRIVGVERERNRRRTSYEICRTRMFEDSRAPQPRGSTQQSVGSTGEKLPPRIDSADRGTEACCPSRTPLALRRLGNKHKRHDSPITQAHQWQPSAGTTLQRSFACLRSKLPNIAPHMHGFLHFSGDQRFRLQPVSCRMESPQGDACKGGRRFLHSSTQCRCSLVSGS